MRLGVHEKDADDQTQEVFMRIYARLDDFKTSGSPRPWLFSFALRVASNYRQLRRHTRELPENRTDHPKQMDQAKNPEEQVVQQEIRLRVLQALDSLDLNRRAIFVMYELDHMAAPAISEALSMPINTVYSRLRKAREEFKKAYNRIELRGDS